MAKRKNTAADAVEQEAADAAAAETAGAAASEAVAAATDAEGEVDARLKSPEALRAWMDATDKRLSRIEKRIFGATGI